MKNKLLIFTLMLLAIITISSNNLHALTIYQSESSVVIDDSFIDFEWKTYDETYYWLESENIPFLAGASETLISMYNLAPNTDIYIYFYEFNNQTISNMMIYYELTGSQLIINHESMLEQAQEIYTMNSINHFTIVFENAMFDDPFINQFSNANAYLYLPTGNSMNLKIRVYAEDWAIKIIFLDYRGYIFKEDWYFTNDIEPPTTYPLKEGGYYNYVATDWKFSGWYSEIANQMVNWDSADTLKDFIKKYAPYDEASGTWNSEIVFEPRYTYVGQGNLDTNDPESNLPDNLTNILGLFNLDTKIGFMILYVILAIGILLVGTFMELDVVVIAVIQSLVLAIFIYFGMLKTWTIIILILTILLSLLWGLKRGKA